LRDTVREITATARGEDMSAAKGETTMTTETDDHGRSNAKAWLGTICEGMDALETLEGSTMTLPVTFDSEEFADPDALRGRLQEGPLSVLVRSDWYTPGMLPDHAAPAEFEILLSTGGPALRIRGDVSEHGEGERPSLQYQDWGTPWTDYLLSDTEERALTQYVRLFYLGGG
jgi:hypothetical protein